MKQRCFVAYAGQPCHAEEFWIVELFEYENSDDETQTQFRICPYHLTSLAGNPGNFKTFAEGAGLDWRKTEMIMKWQEEEAA